MDEVSLHIAAPAEQLYDMVSDIARMGDWSPENTGGRWLGKATGPALGAKFLGWNKHGLVRELTPSGSPTQTSLRVSPREE